MPTVIYLMTRRQLYKFAVDLFIELLTQVQGKRSKPYRCNANDTNAWNAWCKYYDDKGVVIGEELVRKYIEYGLQSWFNPDIQYTQRMNVRFSWIFGSAAIQRWNALPSSVRQFYVTSSLKKDYVIKRKVKSKRLTSLLLRVRPIEEKFKHEYLNTKRGLLWCKANTTLYLHKSSACAICDYKDECKEMLKNNMPNVYRLRGYK